ncbi:MAG TPA: MHYT domain-containing protein, partial [Usitatibacter sp.]|nr:MHYT domain-containing protein [Usitatibacter sp.]
MAGAYNNWVVLVSFLVAVLASYTALDLASRITASTGAAAVSWLLGGAFAMGMGIWSMHFIGMLAFSLPIPMAYDVGITLVSMLIAIIVSGFALLTVTRKSMSGRRLAAGGVLMGIGICSMHYTGMAAMEVAPAIRYDALLFGASVAIAIAAATAALWISFTLRSNTVRRVYARLGSAI